MGFGKLTEIVELYRQHGKENLPIALIQNGSTPNEKIIMGTIDDILDETQEKRIGVPAIIVLGEVVSKHPNFKNIIEKYATA
ncbi:uroporphyrin-III C-methyltransferase [compost metagenome]